MARRPAPPRRPAAPRRPGPAGAHLRPKDQAPSTAATPRPRDEVSAHPTRDRVARKDRAPQADRTRKDDRAHDAVPAPMSRPAQRPDGAVDGDQRGIGRLVPAADRFRELMRPRPWRRRRRAVVITVLVAVLAIVAALLTLLYSPYFAVDEVEVRGVSYVDPGTVSAAVDGARGHSILTLPTDDLARSAAAVPGVRSAQVERRWPHGMRVQVTERTPLATVTEPGGATVIVDADGVPLPDAAGKGHQLVPLQVEDGADDPSGSTRAMLDVVASLPQDLRGRIGAVTASSPTDVSLALTTSQHGTKTLVWGDAKDPELKAKVTAALLEAPGSVIDVSSPVAPVTR